MELSSNIWLHGPVKELRVTDNKQQREKQNMDQISTGPPTPEHGDRYAPARETADPTSVNLQLYTDLLERTSDGILVIDPGHRFVFVNRTAERMLRRRRQRLLGRRVADTVPAMAASPVFQMVIHCLNDGMPESEEMFVPLFKRWIRVRCEAHPRGVLVFVEDIDRRQRAETARDAAHADLARLRGGHRRLLRDVLTTVTEGRLRLCDGELDLPVPPPAVGATVTLTPETLSVLRRRIAATADALAFPLEARNDLLLAAGEAAMNAIAHAGGGEALVRADPLRRRIQVWVRDEGAGIGETVLHRATLEQGWTTAGTLGYGFTLMLRMADRVHLCTSSTGTTVVLERGV